MHSVWNRLPGNILEHCRNAVFFRVQANTVLEKRKPQKSHRNCQWDQNDSIKDAAQDVCFKHLFLPSGFSAQSFRQGFLR